MSLEKVEGIAWYGISGYKLEPLAPRDVKEIQFTAVPLIPGLRSISGIRLIDTLLKRTYSYDDLAQVFVTINDTSNKMKIM